MSRWLSTLRAAIIVKFIKYAYYIFMLANLQVFVNKALLIELDNIY